jgi:FkbM family methyltransferase
LLPLTALLLRARTVRPSVPFVLRETLRRPGVRVYRLAGGGLRVTIRHRVPGDVVTLGEVFHDRLYVPDPDIEEVLDGVADVLDLGANIGLFGAFALNRWPAARITAYEPDPDNIAIHRRTIEINGLEARWRLVPEAAGARDGELQFLPGRATLSRAAVAGEPGAISVPLRDVLPAIAATDLLKLDIEGGEWEILTDPRFRASPPRVVILEYHPYLCPTDDPRATAEEALRAANMRFRLVRHYPSGHGMLWGWRT